LQIILLIQLDPEEENITIFFKILKPLVQRHSITSRKTTVKTSNFANKSVSSNLATKDNILTAQKQIKIKRYKGEETYEKSILYSFLIISMHIQ
jgi:hypothetical protein